jgi:hypothetical protein
VKSVVFVVSFHDKRGEAIDSDERTYDETHSRWVGEEDWSFS